jgi:hypothetical protein
MDSSKSKMRSFVVMQTLLCVECGQQMVQPVDNIYRCTNQACPEYDRPWIVIHKVKVLAQRKD